MVMKRIFYILLVLVTTLTLVTSCTPPNSTPEETTLCETLPGERESGEESTLEEGSSEEETTTKEEGSTTEEETTEEEDLLDTVGFIPLVLGEEAYVTVVYPNEYKEWEWNVATALASFIEVLCGVRPGVKADNQPVDATRIEILIGDTNRTGDAYVSTALTPGQFVIQMVDGRLVVNGSLGDTLYHALEVIEEQILTYGSSQAGDLLLPDTTACFGYVPSLREEFFQVASLTASGLYECGDQCYLLLFEEAASTTMYEYLDVLKSCGMEEKEATRAVLNDPNCLYTMYSDGETMATVFYTNHDRQLRVMVEPVEKNGYYSYVNDNTERVCTPLFLQVGTGKSSGMCYVFRFSNGEFFIYDGGFNDAEEENASVQNCQRIVALLRQYAPNPNDIHIAGWLITHAHIDHIGALVYFCNNYANDETITLENILINTPADFVADQDTSSTGLAKKMNNYREILEKARATGTVLHKTHAGQILQFGDATLEILYTHEMRMPVTLYGSNNLSIVSRMTVQGQTFLITGDTHTHSNRVMEAMYEGSLTCDFYQTPHHGYGANTNTLAKAVNPKWVLWPCNQARYNEVIEKAHNAFLLETDKNRVKGHYIANFQTIVFHLPFDGANYTVTQNEKIE